jgi:hypothetical protein
MTQGKGGYESGALVKPGVYVLKTGEQTYPISVNVPAEESDIRTLDGAGVRAALGDVEMQMEEDQLPGVAAAQAEGRDFGWTVMVLVLGLLGVECYMAMKFGHHGRVVTG